MDNYIEIEYNDGTKADIADQIAAAIESIAGPPHTLLT